MLETLRRFFSRSALEHDLSDVAEWARRRGHGFKRVKGVDGFVVDGVIDAKPWRMEWGPSQRDYITGHELRLRMEHALASDVQMLILSRTLMDTLERQTFEEFTDNVQTQISSKSPEEVRWLVMFQKLSFATLKPLRDRFGGVASDAAMGLAWLEGPLANALERAANGVLDDARPFVLMTLRGRAYLRLQLDLPEPNALSAALVLFEVAVAQAMRAASEPASRHDDKDGSNDASSTWLPTASTDWQSEPEDADGSHTDGLHANSSDTSKANVKKR